MERDLDLLPLSPDRDLFLRPVERLLDRLLLSVDLDLLLPRALGDRDLDRLLRAGDLDRRVLFLDLELDRFRLVPERDLLRRAGDLDRRFFLSDGDTDSLFLTGDLDLDCFFLEVDLDVDRRGDEVERESFLRSTGDNCFFCIPGDTEREELLCCFKAVLTGEEESTSSSEPSEQSDLTGPVAGSLEPDLDLEASLSPAELAGSLCSFSWLGESV